MLHPAPLFDALLSLALGAVLGLVYDILRPPRRAMRKAGAVLDFAFCALAALGAFSLAMRSEGGRFGLWAVGAGFAGFLLWITLASPLFAPLSQRLWAGVEKFVKTVVKIVKKSVKSAKFLFAKMKSCFIIRKKQSARAEGESQ